MVESKLVELAVAGSSPVGHPTFFFAVPSPESRVETAAANFPATILILIVILLFILICFWFVAD